jgi:hypothetical protein
MALPARAALIAAALALASCSNPGADGELPTVKAGETSGTVAGTSSTAGTPSGSADATGPASSTASTDSGEPRSSTTSTDPRPPTSSTTTPAEEHDDGIAWVPFGPATSGVPVPQADSYGRLYAHECDANARSELREDQQHLYEGALAACRAVATNAAADWTTAEHEVGQVGNPGALDCMDSQALHLLQQLVAAHHKRPGTAPTIRPATRASACATTITGAKLDDESGDVVVEGEKLWGVSSATINGTQVTNISLDLDGVHLQPPSALPPGSTVKVVLVQGHLPAQKVTFTVPGTPPPSSAGETSP